MGTAFSVRFDAGAAKVSFGGVRCGLLHYFYGLEWIG
jgi:hypothetical protein